MISFTLTRLVVETLARYRFLVTLAILARYRFMVTFAILARYRFMVTFAIYKAFKKIHVRKFTASANEGKPTALTPNLNITHT